MRGVRSNWYGKGRDPPWERYGGPRPSRWLAVELLGAGEDNVLGKRPSRWDSNRGRGSSGAQSSC